MKPEQIMESISLITAMKDTDLERLITTYGFKAKDIYIQYWHETTNKFGHCEKQTEPMAYIHNYFFKAQTCKDRTEYHLNMMRQDQTRKAWEKKNGNR